MGLQPQKTERPKIEQSVVSGTTQHSAIQTGDKGFEDFKQQPSGAVLSYREMLKADGVDAIRELYLKRRMPFADLKQVYKQIAKDFDLEINFLVSNFPKTLPAKHPVISLELDDGRYTLIGLPHPMGGVKAEYKKLILEALKGHRNVIEEQGVCKRLGIDVPRISLRDTAAISSFKMLYDGVLEGLFVPRLLYGFIESFLPTSKRKDEVLSDAWTPPQVYSSEEIPAHLAIERALKDGKAFNTIMARSAYQAECARRLLTGRNKLVIVGALHVAEVAYFLKHPEASREIANRAEQHVNGKRVNSLGSAMGLFNNFAYIAGGMIGLSPYFVGALYLGQWLVDRAVSLFL